MRLLLDLMCGGLRSYLRMCGHDAAYAGERDLEADDALLAVADVEGRTLVTRDVALAERAPDAIRLHSLDVEAQLVELAAGGVDLELAAEPVRCGACNGPLAAVDPTASTPAYAPDPGTVGDGDGTGDEDRDGNGADGGTDAGTDVWRCRDCGQLFWRGSHWDRVAETLDRVRAAVDDGDSTEDDANPRPRDRTGDG